MAGKQTCHRVGNSSGTKGRKRSVAHATHMYYCQKRKGKKHRSSRRLIQEVDNRRNKQGSSCSFIFDGFSSPCVLLLRFIHIRTRAPFLDSLAWGKWVKEEGKKNWHPPFKLSGYRLSDFFEVPLSTLLWYISCHWQLDRLLCDTVNAASHRGWGREELSEGSLLNYLEHIDITCEEKNR